MTAEEVNKLFDKLTRGNATAEVDGISFAKFSMWWLNEKDRKPPCEKTAFLGHFYIKCIILPRQARDKHRETTQKRCRFLRSFWAVRSFTYKQGEGGDAEKVEDLCICEVQELIAAGTITDETEILTVRRKQTASVLSFFVLLCA